MLVGAFIVLCIRTAFAAPIIQPTGGGTGTNVAPALGGLLVGQGTKVYAVMTAGTDNYCLVASSSAANGIVWAACASGGTGINSLNGSTSSTQTFATSGPLLTIGTSGGVHTFTTLSTSSLGLVPASRNINTTSPITGGSNLGGDLTIACATCQLQASSTLQSLIGPWTLATTSDTNINLNIGASGNTVTLNPTWAGNLSESRGGTATTTVFTAGSVVFDDGNSRSQNNANLFWDNTNFRLGIGTTTPDSALSIPVPGAGTAVAHFGDLSTNSSITKLLVDNRWTAAGGYGFEVRGNTTGNPRFIVDGNGNIIVGTTTAQDIFTISNGSTEQMLLGGITSSTAQSAYINFASRGYVGYDNGQNNLVIQGGGAGNGSKGIEFITGTTTALGQVSYESVITSAGKVGIATTTPAHAFDVYGTVGFTNLSTGAGNGALCMTAAGLVSYDTGANCIVSSERFKNTINPFSDGLAEVLALKPVSFYYDNGVGNTSQQQLGLIAEQVATVDTRLVSYDSQGRPQGLQLTDFYALFTDSIQKMWGVLQTLVADMSGLNAKLNAQQLEINHLQSEINSLSKRTSKSP